MPYNEWMNFDPSEPLDFPYPELIVMRAAWLYAQTDPVMQPRAQYLEDQWKQLMYNLIERDERHTDSPYLNEFNLPVENSPFGGASGFHGHPHSDERFA